MSLLAFADGPTQPDPPVPLERANRVMALSAERDLDVQLGEVVLRGEGHIERWEALSRAAQSRSTASGHARRVHMTSLVEGIVGFPVRQFRLAADEDDGAGSD